MMASVTEMEDNWISKDRSDAFISSPEGTRNTGKDHKTVNFSLNIYDW